MYPPPSAEFVGDGYPPFYFHVCATLATLFGSPLLVARAVSLASTAFIVLALFRVSGGHINSSIPRAPTIERLLPPLLFLAFYAAGGQVFDLARVDMLAIALALWAALLALKGSSLRDAALAGLLMACAILTKHNLLLVGAFIGLGILIRNWRRAWAFGIPAVAIPGLFFLQLGLRTAGWSDYHLFEQLANNEFGGAARWIRFFGEDVSWHGALLASLLAASFVSIWRMSAGATRKALIAALLVALGGLAMTISGRLKIGGYPNNLVPVWTFALFAFASMIPEALVRLDSLAPRDRTVWSWTTRLIALGIIASLAFSFTRMPIRDYLAASRRHRAVAELQNLVSQFGHQGPVWIPAHSGLYPHSDHYAHLCPVGFTMDAPGRPARTMLEDDIAQRLRNREWSAIILDDPRDRFISERIWNLLNQYYEEQPWPIRDVASLAMLSGKKSVPCRLFVRRSATPNRGDSATFRD